MPALLKRLWFALLLLPLTLHAEPVRVATHYQGSMSVDRQVFPALGIDLSDSSRDVPYSITMSSLLDTSLPGANSLGVLEAFGQEVSLTLMIDRQTFEYAGPTLRTYAGTTGRYFYHGVDIALGEDRLWLYSITGTYPGIDRITGKPLIPRELDSDDGIWTSFELSYSNRNSLMGGVDYSSLQVISLVPEPAQGRLALAGLLVLGLVSVRTASRSSKTARSPSSRQSR
ncbi:hypothetical protein [Massilia sp. 9I]|uniref:hypothetical protein n=1 Tax=Massilia sp. 9I TaxID=2653152 RepID=UPI0012F25F6A|nr:hypothetical protein [Massilia sp. 9I]VXC24956.1 conserved exported hypothetical protein [Massilia sp. 9I]